MPGVQDVSRRAAHRRRGAGRGRVRRLARSVIAASAVVLTSSIPALPAGAATTFGLLQMNLCNSGMAVSCYSGRAVDEAVAHIHRHRPDLVALQEVCRDDVHTGRGPGQLARAMADLHGAEDISVTFAPALNRYTGRQYRCLNGEAYGVAMIHHGDGRDVHGGRYDSQDATDELRVWTCTTVIEGRLTGCTTHLSTNPDVAMRQCRELMSVLRGSWVMPEVVVTGDFNLASSPGKPHDVQGCAPAGFGRRGDESVQQIFFTPGIRATGGDRYPMSWTDHPALYELFRL